MNASASGDGRARARDADHYGCLARGTSSWTTSVTLRSLRAALCLRPPMPAVTSMSGTSNRASVASNYEAGRSRCWRLSSSTSATLPPPDGMSTAGRPSTSGTCEPDELPHCNGSDPGPARKCSTTPSVTPHRPGPGGWPPSTATCCGATVAGPGAATSTNCSRSRRSGGCWTHRGCHPGRPLASGLAKTRTSTGYLPEQASRTPSLDSAAVSRSAMSNEPGRVAGRVGRQSGWTAR